MKILFFITVFACGLNWANAQTQKFVPAEITKEALSLLPTKEEMLKRMGDDFPGYTIKEVSTYTESQTGVENKNLPQYDYAFIMNGCYYIAHAHIHSFLGIFNYGDIYYTDELVGCP